MKNRSSEKLLWWSLIQSYDSAFDDDHINISYESTWSQRAPEGVRSQLDPLGASGGELQGWAGEDDDDDSGEVHVHENVEAGRFVVRIANTMS